MKKSLLAIALVVLLIFSGCSRDSTLPTADEVIALSTEDAIKGACEYSGADWWYIESYTGNPPPSGFIANGLIMDIWIPNKNEEKMLNAVYRLFEYFSYRDDIESVTLFVVPEKAPDNANERTQDMMLPGRANFYIKMNEFSDYNSSSDFIFALKGGYNNSSDGGFSYYPGDYK